MSALDIVLLTGISGSGKSVALNALEDAGYFCVDNLPPELLRGMIELEEKRAPELKRRIAVSVDVRSAHSLPNLTPVLTNLRQEGHSVRAVFLDASTDALVRRFSETRRPHPLSQLAKAPHPDTHQPQRRASDLITPIDATEQALMDAINLERELLSPLREFSTVIDTSLLRPAQLRTWIRNIVQAAPSRLTLVFESFAYKHGVPMDADFVFDVRMLPNPFYLKELKPLTGRDQPVIDYLAAQPESAELIAQIEAFLLRWLPALEGDQRSYVTVAIGCTGGQHRSVYCVEQLVQRFGPRGVVLARHREQDAK
ncbi:MAG TPA: RNase adapter RapZ [Aquabacterium sp.]|uniref:RNase adapter RapZ n=1 Tax=Aquabacterium sp. TaxID=1872578 RepID=UPI002E30D7B6|nr:RNase adapter RapZ [Aquabacterium sp.]HEX5357819.1 RNase adapter RapZ [Aquabacterium sp.]